MSLTIELTPVMEGQLQREARANGVTVEAKAQKLLDNALRHQGNLRMISTLDFSWKKTATSRRKRGAILKRLLRKLGRQCPCIKIMEHCHDI